MEGFKLKSSEHYKAARFSGLVENTRDFSHEMNRLRTRRVFWYVNCPTYAA